MTKVGMIMGLQKMENNILSLDSDLVLSIKVLSISKRLLMSLAKFITKVFGTVSPLSMGKLIWLQKTLVSRPNTQILVVQIYPKYDIVP